MSQRLEVLRRVVDNPGLRSVELAFLGFGAAEYGVWVAVLVYAYERGGTTTAAAIAVLQLLPAAVFAPLASGLADRRGGAVMLWIGYVLQAGSIAFSAAAVLLHAPSAVVYFGAVIAASAVTLTRPAQGALLPALVSAPEELTAANVAIGWVESVTLLIGPALAGGLIALDGIGPALGVFAVAVAGSAALVAGLDAPGDVRRVEIEEERPEGRSSLLELLRTEPAVAAVLAVTAVQFVLLGAQDILEVVLGLGVLGLGPGGAGYLGATFGAGAIVGSVGTVSLVGRQRLVGALLAAALAWGAAFVLLGAWTTVVAAFALLAGAGASHTIVEVSSRTLLHRVVPPALHGRVFGLVEGMAMFGLAVGSLCVPFLIDLGGVSAALIVMGALLIVVTISTAVPLRAVERSSPALRTEFSLLRGSPLFNMLAAPALEDLARALVREDVPGGDVVVREGQPGDRFYLISAGDLAVTIGSDEVGRLGPGEGFGEIALLRDGRRMATVTASDPATVYVLERAPFLEAVTGSYHAQRAADELVALRLGSPPTE